MDDGDGMMMIELQAKQIAENSTRYKGSAPCTGCGIMANPIDVLYNKGRCLSCLTQDRVRRVKNKMVG